MLKSKLGSGGRKKGKGGKRKAAAVDETDAKRKKTAEEDEIEKQLKVCLSFIMVSKLPRKMQLALGNHLLTVYLHASV